MTKTVFITGATSGIGLATAQRFDFEGYRLILTGRRLEKLQALQQKLSIPSVLLSYDVRSSLSLEDALQSLPPEFQDIDILVNNAGLALEMVPFQNLSLEDQEIMIDTNIKGLLYTTHVLLKGMLERAQGHIINIGSVAARHAYQGGHVYGATKAFVHQFSHNLRTDLSGTPVRVTVIAPGAVETEFSEVRFKGDREKAAQVYQGFMPLSAQDIAEAVYWVTTLPPHATITELEIMPTAQSAGGFKIARSN